MRTAESIFKGKIGRGVCVLFVAALFATPVFATPAFRQQAGAPETKTAAAVAAGAAGTADGKLEALEREVIRLREEVEAAKVKAPAKADPPQEVKSTKDTPIFRNPKFMEGVEFDLDFYYRFRGNSWGDIVGLGRTDFQSVGSTLATDDLHHFAHNHFFNHRSYVNFRINLPKTWSANLEMDVAGSDFNDGAVLGAEPAGILGAAGMRELSLAVRRFWIEYNGPLRVQVGRLGMRFGQGILANINRDGVRAFKPVGKKLTLVGVWFRGSEGTVLGENGGASTNDKSGVQVPVNPRGTAEDLNAGILLGNIQANKDHRLQFAIAKQVDGTFDKRQPEKLYLDLNGGGNVGPRFTYLWEAAALRGKSPRAAARNARLDNEAYLLFGNAFYRLPDSTLGGKLTLGLASGFGTGDDNPADGKQNAMQSLFVDETAYEPTVVYSDDIVGYVGTAASVNNTQGFNNNRFVQPSLKVQLNRDIAARVTYTFMRAHKAQIQGMGPLGNGRFGADPFLVFPATSTAKSKDIGHEVDVYVDYAIQKNILLFVRGGRFTPGAIFGAGTHDALKVETGMEFKF